jgi:hypothetical protein
MRLKTSKRASGLRYGDRLRDSQVSLMNFYTAIEQIFLSGFSRDFLEKLRN